MNSHFYEGIMTCFATLVYYKIIIGSTIIGFVMLLPDVDLCQGVGNTIWIESYCPISLLLIYVMVVTPASQCKVRCFFT